MTLSISGGDDSHWNIFSNTAQSGRPLLFRSRTRNREVQAFATQNQMMRVRCVLREDLVSDSGMPKSSKDVEDYEDRLLANLKAADAEVYLVAAVTGEGNRDLFFAARDLDDLRAAIKASSLDGIDSFKVQYAAISDIPPFLDMLALSAEQVQAAVEAGRVHGVPVDRKGNLLGKLFGR